MAGHAINCVHEITAEHLQNKCQKIKLYSTYRTITSHRSLRFGGFPIDIVRYINLLTYLLTYKTTS